jgi:hypothetical protein
MSYVTLWVPAADSPRWPCVRSWWDLKTPNNEKINLVPGAALAYSIRYSWNKVIKDFLNSDSEWLFSVHNDVVLPPDALMRLLSWNQPLVSALIFMRRSPVTPHIWKTYPETGAINANRINDTKRWFSKHNEWIKFEPFVMEPRPDDALAEVSFTSTSCTLIHRTVLEGMRPIVNDVWFRWDDEESPMGGEDRNFFDNAIAAGFTPYVDRSVVVGHLVGDIPTSSADFVAWASVSDFKNTGEPEEEND